MPVLTAGVVAIRQGEPPEGRKAFPISGINFFTGNEVFTWSSRSLGAGEPSHIISAFVDASALTAGKTLTININNGQQILVIAGPTAAGLPSQGYVIITAQMPFSMSITTNNGAAAAIIMTLYNYNALFTGASQQTAPVGAAGGSGGTGGSGGGSLGGGGGNQSGGGGHFR
jgi:uncharacterized membrane protein YgcG